MIKDIVLPRLGEGIEGAEVSEVTVVVGDTIKKDDTIVVLESEKASMEIPAGVDGKVVRIFIKDGEEVRTGEILIQINLKGSDKRAEEKTAQKEEKYKPIVKQPNIQPAKQLKKGHSFASPSVRRLSRELEIDLEVINGSGPKGRTTKEDLHGYIKSQLAKASGGLSPIEKQKIDFSQWGEIEIKPLTKVNQITGDRLQRAWQTIPHVTQFDEADITDLDSYRKKLKAKTTKKDVKVTFLPFLMKAAAKMLHEMNIFNSSLDYTGKNMVIKKYIHIGVAVDTPSGLRVPVIRDVNKKSLLELSKELMDVSERARAKRLTPDEMRGGSFTVSSLGGIGGTYFTPIVNPPEVAIMGVSRSRWRNAFDEKTLEFAPRLIMPFSLSYDHRVIDGAAAAAFTSRFAGLLSEVSFFKE